MNEPISLSFFSLPYIELLTAVANFNIEAFRVLRASFVCFFNITIHRLRFATDECRLALAQTHRERKHGSDTGFASKVLAHVVASMHMNLNIYGIRSASLTLLHARF